AGPHPEVGMTAAEESNAEIGEHLDGVHMVFITAGMGGGTGTGAAPIIAKCARERGILTVGVVTKPFHFEGRHRMRLADAGIAELQRYVDTLIVIPNQNLFRLANEKTTFAEAFALADKVLDSGVRSITDLMILPGLINLDFADVRTVMTEMGKAMMGTGEASGEDRALVAAQNAIANPLLDEVTLKGAKAVLVNVTGGPDMTLLEVDEACNAISAEVDPDANTIFGAAFDDSLQGKIRVSVVATGMDGAAMSASEHTPVRVASFTPRPMPMPTPVSAAVAQAAAAPEPVRAEPEPVAAQASLMEDVAADEPAMIEDEDFSLPMASEAPAPIVVKAAEERPITRIVDPSVEDEEDDAPLFAEPIATQEPRGRFLSLFGARRSQDAPSAYARPPAMSREEEAVKPAASAPAAAAEEEEDDLEIPSFLRRLAN
ncbi:MAG: cell division protein FtsZ, partial [Caulobacteraceae bacterium]